MPGAGCKQQVAGEEEGDSDVQPCGGERRERTIC